mmetsp:Transcript_22266/g.42277  ORF Transcript_22266/g.42277 Transcript_22266/m.42277 type:complete len:122 (+) Transcript_22266:180-545(+)
MNNTSTRNLDEHLASPTLRRQSRKKTVSSLQGMFAEEKTEDLKSVGSFDSFESAKYSCSERDSLRAMSRTLRQAKRKLLLKCVETPTDPVDKLRDILLKISIDSVSDEMSTSIISFGNEGG